jgi:hypothetical protein
MSEAKIDERYCGYLMSDDSELKPLLARSKRNWLAPGIKVQMSTGEILTVKSLEFRDFVSHERVGYIPKKDIHTIVEC